MGLDDVKRCRARNRDANAKRVLHVVGVSVTNRSVEDTEDAGTRDIVGSILLVAWVLSAAAAAARTAEVKTVDETDDVGMRGRFTIAAGWTRFTGGKPFKATSSIATGTEAGAGEETEAGAKAKTALLLVGGANDDDDLRIPRFFNTSMSLVCTPAVAVVGGEITEGNGATDAGSGDGSGRNIESSVVSAGVSLCKICLSR
jgi:hypothetical protein